MAESHTMGSTAAPRRRTPCNDVLAAAAAADPLGHRIHIALAMLWAFTIPLQMIPAAKDIALVLLLGWAAIRALLGGMRSAWRPLFSRPLAWFLTAWGLWTCATMLWSVDPQSGLEELANYRSFLVPLAVFPILLELRRMLWAFLAGAAIVNLIQAMQAMGVPGFTPEVPDRFFAWMAPNPGGLLIAAAFVAHAAWLVVERRGGLSFLHIAGAALAALGLALMQNRGGMVAAVLAIIILLLTVVALLPRARSTVLLVATCLTFGLSAGLLIDDVLLGSSIGDPVRQRMQEGIDDVQDAPQYEVKRLVQRSVTFRLTAWRDLLQIIQARPLGGTGLGGLAPALLGVGNDAEIAAELPPHRHGHNTWLFTAAATGLIGLALMLCTIGGAALDMLRRLNTFPETMVCLGILLTWVIANLFDSLILSGGTSCLLILGLLASFIPRENPAT